jgi:hypothetical protein
MCPILIVPCSVMHAKAEWAPISDVVSPLRPTPSPQPTPPPSVPGCRVIQVRAHIYFHSSLITALVLGRIGVPGEAPVQTVQICLLEFVQIVVVLQGLGLYGRACSGLFWAGVRGADILGSMCSLRSTKF